MRKPQRHAPVILVLLFAMSACSVARGGGSVALPGDRGGQWRGGVGAVFRYGSSTRALTVHEAPAGGAAARAGLHAGDVVVAIDGAAVSAMEQHEVIARLRGEVGTTVTLRVRREGAERDVRVERGPYGRRERD